MFDLTKAIYTDDDIAAAVQVLVDHGVDIDAIPDECVVLDLIRMAGECERPN